MGTSFTDLPLWEPSETLKQQATVTRYMRWLNETRGLQFEDREALWRWSVDHLEDFWASVWDFFQIQAAHPYTTVLQERTMPGAVWFPGAELNYAEHVFRNATTDRPALLFRSERHALQEISWDELTRTVGALARALQAMGVQRGDRVVAYMPNIPQTVMAFLACASIGAIWSSCSPDFGTSSVIDRFKQIEPKVLIAVDGYQYNGKSFDRRAILAELQQALPTLQHTVLVPYLFGEDEPLPAALEHVVPWNEMVREPGELHFTPVPFDHPLWILYSSGTTGLPKAIVQGHGGILLEHLKSLALDMDLKAGDRFFWFTTTGWMMWNFLVSGLLVGCVTLLYDGSPGYPDMGALWKFAQDTSMTLFGASAAYVAACMKSGIEPGKQYDLHHLKGFGSTGSPLPPEGFRWIYEQVKPDIWLASVSGGTDVCSAFVGGSILLPVYAGELQCRMLGAKVEAYDEEGKPLIDEVGELVLTVPMPSMPLYFWNDPARKRYHESYFAMYPGVWRHGDWIKITPRGSAIIYGRSDSTINRQGIRIGSSEIYRVVEGQPEVLDSLIVGVELPGGKYYLPLFVVLREGETLTEELKARIKTQLRRDVSPHHIPDEIIQVDAVPRTLSGKKVEVPIKKLFMGVPQEKCVSADALSNPQAMQFFSEFAPKVQRLRDGKAS
ncbi:acetoacetyl-CoA synthetase [Thermosporothrix hazakensis]|jgi:acetoacetyl-CoA synthetase|uniref:Acetoacetyl-CoA synthetase n=2 Tax=Thermosporothrix TaxID=768650 RepID=A0A326U299_THEHA|nr:acetoacetate--CoA ligase [Thermosporothrix hazakensis]PZW25404.1 acetoacetyl-CoA synthetase [Thermosporothrix hazakensis]BBH90739.1 acetoacetyl-CoA synthetase [Thermosporothrix sp. COM3]GCE48789.1 acetoacetyl-CoA synthetase [Thermosporothrix hazakensis]